jgi:hypothetical protein
MKFTRPPTRIDPKSIGITDPEQEKMEAATGEDGKVNLSSMFPVPPKTESIPEQQTVLKLIDEKGYAQEEELYKKEYQLRVTHQIMLNGGSTAQIATKLGVSPAEARKLKNELSARLIQEMKRMDKNQVAGKAMLLYDHIQAKGLQVLARCQGDKSLRTQVEALKVVMQAETDRQKFLTMAGFWNIPLSQGMQNFDSHIEGANEMREILNAVISGDEVDIILDDEQEAGDGINLL